jgi:hypothetical protein
VSDSDGREPPEEAGSPIEPCVVYLVRCGTGMEPFVRFLASYHAHPAGPLHELAIVFKGFREQSDARHHLRLAGERVDEALFVDDRGFDLTAYFAVASRLRRARYCFLNSYSEIVADGWLGHLNAALDDPTVGLVGATGSWASIRSYLRYHLGLGGSYRRVFNGWRDTKAVMARLGSHRDTTDTRPRSWLSSKLATIAEMRDQALHFDTFPSHHVRTNAFMLSNEVFEQLDVPALKTKVDAYRVESGRMSLTKQVEALGLRVAVVSRDGTVYDQAMWPLSGVFWQRGQEGLLVSDNQTRTYEQGGPEIRLLLSRFAWGDQADVS